MKTPLQAAIESVYRAFSDVTRPPSIKGCPCCLTEKQICILLAKPLRVLSPDELTNYAESVLLTVGAIEDFIYFLPRILEILVTDSDWWPNPEVVLRRMKEAGFQEWPAGRKLSVLSCFKEIISELLSREGDGYELDSWICALGNLQTDLGSYLQKIVANPPRLIEYYEVNSQPLTFGRLNNSFWNEAIAAEKTVVEWFKSAEIVGLINQQYGLS